MIEGKIIVDAVVYPWNMSPENQNPAARPKIDAVYASHTLSFDAAHAGYALKPDEFFHDYQFPQELQAEFKLRPLTEQDRANILGLNGLKLYGFDAPALMPRIAQYCFAAARQQGVPQPWSNIRG